MHDPLLFLLAVLVVLGTPGPTNTLLAASGALIGVRRSLLLLVGEVAGYLIAIACLHLVIGGLVTGTSWIATALRLAMAAYLLFVAYELWTRPAPSNGEAEDIGVRRVFVTTLLNPKALVFAFEILPLSKPGAAPYVLAFSALIPLAGFSWIAAGAFLGKTASRPGSRAVPRVSAAVLAVFAVLIATG
ncbi:MAG: LysE family translocator [Parvibaculaceae bacterium]